MHKIGNPLYYAAAATTAIGGILHLILISPLFNPYVLGTNILSETFFIVAGIAQIFWALPMVKRWGKNMVLHWNCRYCDSDNIMGINKSTKSNYSRQSISY